MSLTKAQQAIRATGYGSSEVATICGLNRWESPIKVFERKVHEETAGRLFEESSIPAALGTMLEAPVATLYQRRTGRHLRLVQTLSHPERSIVKATPDRAVFVLPPAFPKRMKLGLEQLEQCDRFLEVKTVDERDRRYYGAPGSDVVPEEKLCQVIWQMGATRGAVKLCDLAVLFGRRSWEIFSVKYSETLFEQLFELVARFDRDHVQARKPPPVDGSRAYADYLARVHPFPVGPQQLASDEDEAVMLSFMKLKAVEARVKKLLERQANVLRARIGDSHGLKSSKVGEVNLLFNRGRTPVEWEAAFREVHALCALIVMSMPSKKGQQQLGQQLADVVARHTGTAKPYRWFQVKPVKGSAADFGLQRLELVLDRLEAVAGEGPTEASPEEVDPSSQSNPQ